MKKSDIINFLRAQSIQLNSVWAFINGGGANIVSPDEMERFIEDFNNDDYYDELERIEKGDEPADFRDLMREVDYDGTECFYRVRHDTGYNQENVDIIIQYWGE